MVLLIASVGDPYNYETYFLTLDVIPEANEDYQRTDRRIKNEKPEIDVIEVEEAPTVQNVAMSIDSISNYGDVEISFTKEILTDI